MNYSKHKYNDKPKKRNPRQIKSNDNDILNDADNFENFEDTCITVIDTISDTIASTSKNGNSDGMTAYRAPSSARGKGTLMPAATFDACKLLISNKKRQEIKENEETLEKQPRRSNRNKISN
jgi:hypothetical protein